MTLERRYKEAYEMANRYDQEHVLRFWEGLTDTEKETLLAQLNALDYALVDRVYRERSRSQELQVADFSPPRLVEKKKVEPHLIALGEEVIKLGKVALFIVAGGQGSRLGFEGPKGKFPATPVTHKPLFQVFCEMLAATNKRYDTTLDLYIMTSDANHEETVAFFKEHAYFGLPPDSVAFFQQHMLPALDDQGRILLSEKHQLSLAPGGTGGIYRALYEGGILERMATRGITLLHYINVDNPLVHVLDPAFIGQHLYEEAEMSCKVVEKTYPDEKVGVIVDYAGTARVVEYIFLPEEMRTGKDKDGRLLYHAASIANHLLNRDFIERIATQANLPYFLAKKKVNCLDAEGRKVAPETPNAYKCESFVFDALPMAAKTMTMLVERDDEFAPIKNAEGEDSPASSKNMQVARAKRWLAGIGIPHETVARLETVEISPFFALTEEEFVKKATPHKDILTKQLKGKTKVHLAGI